MIRNVFGDFQITGKDYAIKIVEELNHSYFISIEPNLKTNKGVTFLPLVYKSCIL